MFVFSNTVFAKYQSPYLIRSPKALLMGDAYTAVNNDEFTMYYNPASLSRHANDLTLYTFPGQVNGNNVLADSDKFQDFPQTTTGAADLLMNYPVHVSAGTSPGFRMFNFGFSILTQDSVDLIVRNQANPMLEIDYHVDRGFIAGYSHVLGDSKLSKKSRKKKKKETSSTGTGSQTSIGFGLKYIKRKGLADSLFLGGAEAMDIINNSENLDEIGSLLGVTEGQTLSYDIGFEHVERFGPFEWVFGLAGLDVLNAEFTEDSASIENGKEVADIKRQVNLGSAIKADFGLVDFTISADIRQLSEQIDPLMRTRLGFALGLPGLTLMGGVNSGYYSYGAMLNLGIVKVLGGFYDLEMGNRANQIKNKRFVIYINLFSFSFDA